MQLYASAMWLVQAAIDRWADAQVRALVLAHFRPLAFQSRHIFFSCSSFFYSLIGLYLILREDQLVSKVSSEWPWKIEGMMLVVQGVLSYLGDVYFFGLSISGSLADVVCASSLFCAQIAKPFFVQMNVASFAIYGSGIVVAIFCFVTGQLAFAKLLAKTRKRIHEADPPLRDQTRAADGNGEKDMGTFISKITVDAADTALLEVYFWCHGWWHVSLPLTAFIWVTYRLHFEDMPLSGNGSKILRGHPPPP
jgi:hypothetical protein